MLIALICTDKPDHLETRKANRDAHVAYLKSSDAVVQAGPFLDEQGDMYGSMIILDLPDMNAAHRWAAADPYAKAGLFSEVRLEQWNKVIG